MKPPAISKGLSSCSTSEEGKRPREAGTTDTTTATNHSDKMPDPDVGTPNPAKMVKFANPGQEGALFPQLQSRTYVQKGLLTNSLNSLETTAEDFGQASEETRP